MQELSGPDIFFSRRETLFLDFKSIVNVEQSDSFVLTTCLFCTLGFDIDYFFFTLNLLFLVFKIFDFLFKS